MVIWPVILGPNFLQAVSIDLSNLHTFYAILRHFVRSKFTDRTHKPATSDRQIRLYSSAEPKERNHNYIVFTLYSNVLQKRKKISKKKKKRKKKERLFITRLKVIYTETTQYYTMF